VKAVPDYILRELARQVEAESRRRLRSLFGTASLAVERLLPDGRPDVLHACPEHDIGAVPPLCPVCLGSGLVDDERLDRWLAWVNRGRDGQL
jgi:hypothetical protein